jgi:hypothetical protein
VGRVEKAVGLALVVIGVLVAWRPPELPQRPRGRVLVLLDAAVKDDREVRAAFVDPGPPRSELGAEFAVRESPLDAWDAVEVSEIATRAEHFDAVVAVSDGRHEMDTAAARTAGAALAARGAPVSVVFVSRAAPAPPPRRAEHLPPALHPARPVRVLYVEGEPRWEFHYLSNALCRDRNLLAHTWLINGDAGDRRTASPEWPKFDPVPGLPSGTALDSYDVLVLGDLKPTDLCHRDDPTRDVASEIRAFVERGGGLLVIAGPQHMPREWEGSALMDALPVVPVPAGPARDPASGFRLALTSGGATNPILDIAADPVESRRMWESEPSWEMFWASPAKPAAGATALALVGDEPSVPAIAMRDCGKGRVLWVGVDELWRIRIDAGDRWFWRFYGAAIGWLAEPKAGVVPLPPVAPPPAPVPPVPPGAAALHALAESSGGCVGATSDAAGLVVSLRQVQGPALPAPPRDPWMIAGGVAAAICGAFFLLRRRAA